MKTKTRGATVLPAKETTNRRDGLSMKFKWAEPLGNPECPYVIRWVADFGLFSLRLHHWVASDDQRYYHDHEWWYITFILKGYYWEHWPPKPDDWRSGERLKAGNIRYRPATHQHMVDVPESCWSFLLTGPKVRDFGFWVKGKFRKRNKYFFEHGHHPCD